MKKILVFGIIILFITVSVTPSINANYSISPVTNKIVEIPFQIYGIDGIESYTISVTKNQINELDAFVDTFKQELDNSETLEETIKIFNDGVVTLDENGLIPKDVSVIELQTAITGNDQLSYKNPVYKHVNINSYRVEYKNRYCLIAGDSSNTGRFPTRWWIAYGGWDYMENREYSANGWIYTEGAYGKWSYEGKFQGTLSYVFFPGVADYYIGVTSFFGIFIRDFYIGFAGDVGIVTI